MRKLSILCRKLRRVTGCEWQVVRHSGPCPEYRYTIFRCAVGYDRFFHAWKDANTIAECEHYLLEQFRI